MAPWEPTASLLALKARAEIAQRIRAFFGDRGLIEVFTPALAPYTASAPQLDSFKVEAGQAASPLYLQTSPESAMKRLLAAGIGPIYQLGPAFRAGESGRVHHPEFQMLEWYRPGYGLEELMEEVSALVRLFLPGFQPHHTSYRELFQQVLGVDPFDTAIDELIQLAEGSFSAPMEGTTSETNPDFWLDLLMVDHIEPYIRTQFPQGLYVTGFPESQAALARCQLDGTGRKVALRFELYVQGLELANGYDELDDPEELRRRIERDQRIRQSERLPAAEADERLLAAMAAGLPQTSGVALGVDRLAMVVLGADRIQDVIPFARDLG